MRRKFQGRESKGLDKVNPDLVCAAFNLQQVISSPKLSISSACYLRKLNLYNFTILNVQSLQGNCYTWNERECDRGAKDIAACVWKWLKDRENEGVRHVFFL